MITDELVIREAQSARDFTEVTALCHDFLSWLRSRYPDALWMIDRYYEPAGWAALLADLPNIHAPPEGEVLVAERDGRIVGCVMMQRLEDGVCEMKRLFVPHGARGQGIGRRLCERLMEIAVERGYKVMRLDTGIHHNEAVPLYRSLGFEMRDAYYDCPDDVAPFLHFMEARLPRESRML
jgi:GNAT superfamily N-acetyltransferase